jgi:hypothetical protein
MESEFKLKYPEFASPRFFQNGLYSTFTAAVDDDQTVTLFGQKLYFDPSTPAPTPGTELEICTGRWYLSAERPATREAREAEEKLLRERSEAKLREAQTKRQRTMRESAARVNASLNIPVRWTSGQKSVLSGLSESSMGDGRNSRSVNHVLLLEPLTKGRVKRDKLDLLCTAKGGTNGRGYSSLETFNVDADGKYVSEVTCKRCLELAGRWNESDGKVEPELVTTPFLG